MALDPPQPRQRAQAVTQPHELLMADGRPPQLLATLAYRPLDRPSRAEPAALTQKRRISSGEMRPVGLTSS
jgi:hypothetical protein